MTTASQPRTRRAPAWLVGSGVIAVAMAVMNVATYAFTLIAARLGPREYGQVAASMGVLLILNVVSLGLQATGARRISFAPDQRAAIERDVMTATWRAAAAVGLGTLLLVPVLATLLRLEVAVAVLVAVAAVPLTLMGGQAGVLQGERRWLGLAGVYLGMGLGRVGAGGIALIVRPDAVGAMAGVAVGAVVPAVIGGLALRRRDQARAPRVPGRPVLAEVARNSHALLAFFALSNSDVLVARAVLDDHQSGLYAGGLILTKAVLFMPQFVVVLLFPSLSEAGARRGLQTRALLLIAAMGSAVALAVAVLADLAVLFVGGEDYAELAGRLWAFALLGTVLALVQLLVYGVVARQHPTAVYVLWAGLAVLVASSAVIGSLTDLLLTMLFVMSSVFTCLALLGIRQRGRR